MDRNVEISMLLEVYGKILTEKQYSVLDNYYNSDLSLSEIAENNGITRQAVRDNIKKGECKLFEFEEKLGIMKKMLENEQKIARAIAELTKITNDSNDKKVQKVLSNIRHKLSVLI
jgi:predicted DNA-binding protein YlxM (UPF0122 family)